MESLEVTAHVRAHIISEAGGQKAGAGGQKAEAGRRKAELPWPEIVLFLDSETTIDLSQRLLFGAYRVDRKGEPIAAGLFAGDRLSEAEERLLLGYARGVDVPLLTRQGFVKEVLFYWAYRAHHRAGNARHMRGAICGFNPAFDLARLAFRAAPTANTRVLRGGWTFDLLGYDGVEGPRRDIFYPSVQIRHLAGGAMFSLTKPRNGKAGDPVYSYAIPEGSTDNAETPNYAFRGHILDLKSLADALTGRDLSLRGACESFGVPYSSRKVPFGRITEELINHCHEDVEATAQLYYTLLEEYRKWNIDTLPDRIYSGASLGKGVLAKARLTNAPPVSPGLSLPGESPDSLAGYGRAAFYAGRMECPIKGELVPVVPLDGRSMYGHIAYLLGLWRLAIAEEIVAEEAAAEVQGRLNAIMPGDLLRPETWHNLNALCLVAPEYDIVPIRSHPREHEAEELGTSLPEIESGPPEGLWYGLPDVVASKIATGRAPKIIRALQFSPRGIRAGLKPTTLRGEIAFDPIKDDLFAVALRERACLLQEAKHNGDTEAGRTADALKIVLSGTGYGIWGEEHSIEPDPRPQVIGHAGARPRKVHIYAGNTEPLDGTVPRALMKGDYYCPVIATLVTSGARLLLALIEHAFTEAGGTIANAVTDGLCVVSTEAGGLVPCAGGKEQTTDGQEAVRALPWAQVDELRSRFASLSPFGPEFLRVEGSGLNKDGTHRPVLFYGVSTLRYCLFDAEGRALKPSAHVLGLYTAPDRPEGQGKDWLAEAWEYILACATDADTPGPAWLDDVAFVRRTIAHPSLLKRLESYNEGKPYSEQAKPFGFHTEPAGRLRAIRSADETNRTGISSGLIVIERDPQFPETWLGWDPRKGRLARLVHPREIEEDGGLPWEQQRSAQRFDAWLERPWAWRLENQVDPPEEIAGVTWREILEDYACHPERKLRAPDGGPCEFDTQGLLRRATVRVVGVEPIGKGKGLQVTEPQKQGWPAALEWLRATHTTVSFAEEFGYSLRMAQAIFKGSRKPSAEKMAQIVEAHRKAKTELQEKERETNNAQA